MAAVAGLTVEVCLQRVALKLIAYLRFEKAYAQMIVSPNPIFFAQRSQIVQAMTRQRDLYLFFREYVQAGGLTGLWTGFSGRDREVGHYVGREILGKSRRPTDGAIGQV